MLLLTNLNPEINLSNFEESNPHSQETQCISVTQTNSLMMFRKIIIVYFEKCTKHIVCRAKSDSLNSKGLRTNHYALNDQ
jgi:hypothetical protein